MQTCLVVSQTFTNRHHLWHASAMGSTQPSLCAARRICSCCRLSERMWFTAWVTYVSKILPDTVCLFFSIPILEKIRLLPWKTIKQTSTSCKRWSLICNTASQYFHGCFPWQFHFLYIMKRMLGVARKFTIFIKAVLLAFFFGGGRGGCNGKSCKQRNN